VFFTSNTPTKQAETPNHHPSFFSNRLPARSVHTLAFASCLVILPLLLRFFTRVGSWAVVPGARLTPLTNIFEKLLELRRLRDLRAIDTAWLFPARRLVSKVRVYPVRRREAKVIVDALLHPLLAQDGQVELNNNSRIDQLVTRDGRMHTPQRGLTVQLKVTPPVTGLVTS
jgi:hypothetical protein